jgi:hypothetical protein
MMCASKIREKIDRRLYNPGRIGAKLLSRGGKPVHAARNTPASQLGVGLRLKKSVF